MTKPCPICDAGMKLFGRQKILGKYPADYFHCQGCGFMQVPDAHWLGEAYTNAMTGTDIGHVMRTDMLAPITRSVIHAYGHPNGRFLDYGAGYGLFVRKMRDFGYNFSWHDKYCENLFARGFEDRQLAGEKYDLATAFEVFEHFTDPAQQIPEILAHTRELLFTTDLLQPVPPPFERWVYYAPEHGQHLAFYSERSLRHLAGRHGLNYYTNGANLHYFTPKKINPTWFRLLVRRRVSLALGLVHRHPTLLDQDFQRGRERLLASQQSQGPQ